MGFLTKAVKLHIDFMLLNGPCQPIKAKRIILRHWTLKRFFSDFCGQSLICELILALVSLWLLINSFKETSKEKRLIDFFGYFIQRYFDYFIIILPFFYFNRHYCVNDRLDFILTVIKRDYNTNDLLKFILSIIKWERPK